MGPARIIRPKSESHCGVCWESSSSCPSLRAGNAPGLACQWPPPEALRFLRAVLACPRGVCGALAHWRLACQ